MITPQKVSIIIPTYNSQKTIARLLKSIKTQTYRNFEIIVVDNFSKDHTVKIARQFTSLVFTSGSERSAQRNYGAQKSQGPWLLFIDSDQALSQKCLLDALKSANDHNLDALIIPELVSGSTYWSQCLNLEKQIYQNIQSVQAARLVKKSVFLKIGGFDENLIAAEDWDLHQRLVKSGSKISISKSPIYNLEENSTLFSLVKKKFYYAKNIKKYAKKHPKEFATQANFILRLTNRSALSKIAADPAHGIGLLFLKSVQALAGLAAQI